MGLRAAMAFALLGLGGAAMVPGFGVYDIVALAGGSVAAGGIFALERRRYLESRSRVALAPERFLDLLRCGRQRRSAATKRVGRAGARLRTTASPARLRRRDFSAAAVAAGGRRRLAPSRVGRRGRLLERDVEGPVRARRPPSAAARCSPAAAARRPGRRARPCAASLASCDLDGHDAHVLVVLLAEHVRARRAPPRSGW